MDTAMSEVRKMVIEVNSHHNDGYVINGYKNELIKIYHYIEKQFPELKDKSNQKMSFLYAEPPEED